MRISFYQYSRQSLLAFLDDAVVKRLIKFLNELNLRLAEKEIARQEMPALRKEMVIA